MVLDLRVRASHETIIPYVHVVPREVLIQQIAEKLLLRVLHVVWVSNLKLEFCDRNCSFGRSADQLQMVISVEQSVKSKNIDGILTAERNHHLLFEVSFDELWNSLVSFFDDKVVLDLASGREKSR